MRLVGMSGVDGIEFLKDLIPHGFRDSDACIDHGIIERSVIVRQLQRDTALCGVRDGIVYQDRQDLHGQVSVQIAFGDIVRRQL